MKKFVVLVKHSIKLFVEAEDETIAEVLASRALLRLSDRSFNIALSGKDIRTVDLCYKEYEILHIEED